MRKWVSLLIGVIFLAAALLVHRSVVIGALNTLPEAALASAVPPISVKAFSQLNETMAVTPLISRPGYIQSHGVTAYYTTADAPAFFGLTMKYGDFEPWQDGYAVISSQLAVALFLTDNAIGQTIPFGGREYTVCGVYSLPGTLLAQASQTTEGDIFLPLESYPDQNAGISAFMVGLKDVPSTAGIAPELETKLGARLIFRSAYNFDETRRLALQSEKLQWLLLALTLCVLSGWWAVQLVIGLVKSAIADSYRAVLTDHKREALFCAAALLCFAAGVFWISSSPFSLFLPQDFITNRGSVVAYIIGNFQLGNMKSSFFLCAFSTNVKTVLTALDVCTAAALFMVACRAKSAIDDLLRGDV